MASYEVIIIGAGWAGLVAAKTYLELKPETSLLIVDNASTIGGTWSKERLYPHLLAEAHIGFYEFSDFEMKPSAGKVTPTGQITGEAVHEYLASYTQKHGLEDRLSLKTRVLRAKRQAGLWHLQLSIDENEQNVTSEVTAEKLIVATGLTSEPFMPEIPNNGFDGTILHSRDLGCPQTTAALHDPAIRTVAVYGSSKSAFDTVYVALRAGKRVEWIIRGRKGIGGPSVMSPLRMNGQDAVPTHYTRFLAAMSPNILNIRTSRVAQFFHGPGVFSWLRKRLIMGYWRTATGLLTAEAQYEKSRNGQLLRPALGPDTIFWSPASLGVMTQPSLWDDIHQGTEITVHENTIESFEHDCVCLDDGSRLKADMVILATGWKALPDDFFFSKEDRLRFGLSSPCSFDVSTENRWVGLRNQSDQELTQLLPILKQSPRWTEHQPRVEDDFHLYRSIIPASSGNDESGELDRSLAYIGFLRIAHSTVVFEAQSLWAAAYLQGHLDVPPIENREEQTALFNGWVRRRYLYGRKLPYALNEFLPYVDVLYKDLGVNSFRKRDLLSEMFEPYKPSDFKSVIREWQSRRTSRLDKVQKSGSPLERSWAKVLIGSCILGSIFSWAIATQL